MTVSLVGAEGEEEGRGIAGFGRLLGLFGTEPDASRPRANRGGVTKAPSVFTTGGAFGVVRPRPT
ncbi:hypothetical protein ACFYSF_47140 [Streptomyces canus]|uniref:hypothetical protein n=1 Tax=Streptomyces canus TaxID=58343 RepID=UPI003688C4A7